MIHGAVAVAHVDRAGITIIDHGEITGDRIAALAGRRCVEAAAAIGSVAGIGRTGVAVIAVLGGETTRARVIQAFGAGIGTGT